jgi:hypothetical protein
MKNQFFYSKEFLFLIGFLALCVLSLGASYFWQSVNLNGNYVYSTYFERYDYRVAEGDFCFDTVFKVRSIYEGNWPATVFVNGDRIKDFNVPLVANCESIYLVNGCVAETKIRTCFDSNILRVGDNKVLVNSDGNIFFNIKKILPENSSGTSVSVNIIDINSEGVLINTSITQVNSFEPLFLYLNGNKERIIYPGNGENTYFEKIDFSEGKNNIEIAFSGKVDSAEIEIQNKFEFLGYIGISIFVFFLFVLIFFVFSNKEFFEKIILSIVSLVTISIIFIFIIVNTAFISKTLFLLGMLLIAIVLLFKYKNNFSFRKINIGKDITKNILLISIIAVALIAPMCMNFYSTTNYSHWNTFYERHAADVRSGEFDYFDDLSYLGRPLTFTQGYFFLEAGIGWFSGLESEYLFALMNVFANLFLVLAIIYFGKKFSLSTEKSIFLYLCIWLVGFIRNFFFLSPRHVISIALLFIVLAMVESNRNKKQNLFTGIISGIIGFIQFPFLIAMPILNIVLQKKIKWKNIIITFITGIVVFLILYGRILLETVFYQAQAEQWGYLINYTWQTLLLDFNLLLILAIVFIGVNLYTKKFDFHRVKLTLFFLLGFAVQLLFMARWNVFNTIIIAFFVVISVPQKILKNKLFQAAILILFIIFSINLVNNVPLQTTNVFQTEAYSYLADHASSSDNILTDPFFGHNVTFFSERKVLADLAVENAPPEKLSDSYQFLIDRNYSVLDKYSIDWILNQSHFIAVSAEESYTCVEPIEFNKLDKVFSDGFVFIHRVR